MLSLLVLVCIVVAAADGVEAAAMGEHGPSEFTAACIAGAAQRADDAVVAGAAASDGASIIAEDSPALNVIVPLGGLGSRFSNAGYSRVKPFVRVNGIEMLALLLRKLSLRPADQLLVVYNPQPPHGIPQGYEQAIRDAVSTSVAISSSEGGDCCPPNCAQQLRFVRLNGTTSGAAETVAYGLRALLPIERARPTVLLDGDTVYHRVDVLQRFRDAYGTFAGDNTPSSRGGKSRGVGAVFVFPDDMDAPVYSYVRLSQQSQGDAGAVGGGNGCAATLRPPLIDCIKEKDKVGMSPLACSGCYCFADGGRLLEAIEACSDSQDFQDNHCGKGELYTSGVIARMLRDDEPFVALTLRAPGEDFVVLGTPSQLLAHLRATPCRPKRFCFDLDGTLVTAPRVTGDYSTCEPIPTQVDNVRKLYSAGHTIIIHTARRMRTHGGNVGGVVADIGEVTLLQLRTMGIPFDEIVFGKPYAHFYVDDKAVSPFEDLEKETGVLLNATCSLTSDTLAAARAEHTAAGSSAWSAAATDATATARSASKDATPAKGLLGAVQLAASRLGFRRTDAPISPVAHNALCCTGVAIAACACLVAAPRPAPRVAPESGRLGEGIAYGVLFASMLLAVA